MTTHWQGEAGDPVQLAALVVDFNRVLASDLRAIMRDGMETWGDPGERDQWGEEIPRLKRMKTFLEWLDRELGPDEEHVGE